MASKKSEIEIRQLEEKITKLHEQIIEKSPSHFTIRDTIYAFFSSFLFGITFIFKGLLVDISLRLEEFHLAMIIMATVAIVSMEIYFVGYKRVPFEERKQRKFNQFWAKRFVMIYGVSLLASFMLIYIYGLDSMVGGGFNIFKVIVAVSLPCAVGSAIPTLLKKY